MKIAVYLTLVDVCKKIDTNYKKLKEMQRHQTGKGFRKGTKFCSCCA